ncbi:MAG: DUF1592 domain-containing protein [Armatimonadota bacterium]
MPRSRPIHRLAVLFAAAAPALLAWTGSTASAPPKPTPSTLAKRFDSQVKPILATYCAGCHTGKKPQAQFDLGRYPNLAAVIADLPHWSLTLERVEANEMPPSGARQPSARERRVLEDWIRDVREYEINRTAGDPGPVLARRLSNAEYDYTIRDLTGVDLRPTRAFPVDPANQEGFDNTGESLSLSPALARKYYEAARSVADNLALTSTGFAFASHPVLAETDRDKFCVLRIVDFYRRQPTDIADYLVAAWRYRHRGVLGLPVATLGSIAADAKISPRYLELVWTTLADAKSDVGPMARLRSRFNELPVPSGPGASAPRGQCVAIRDWVVSLRRRIAWSHPNLSVSGDFATGSYTNVLFKDHLYAGTRRRYDARRLQIGGSDPDLAVPADEAARAPFLASFEQFASVFPDTFYVDERGLMEGDAQYERSGRFLTGGTHNATSYFRDDAPLMELILDDAGRREIDTLWRDFAVVAEFNERMYLQGIFYERNEARTILVTRDPEFNFARSEDRTCASTAQIRRFRDFYLAKARKQGTSAATLAAYDTYFQRSTAGIEQEDKARIAAEPLHRKALLEFAQRAWRRPLVPAERTEILATYERLRTAEKLGHEEAIRDSVVRILLSPRYLFRVDSAQVAPPRSGGAVLPLANHALASRLSYFLWSSLPDTELLALADKGELSRPEVLLAQARRMLKDPKARALAVEFGGNWLDFRRFEEHNAVDRERFPRFDDTLRSAMFEEPVRFLTDLFQNNGSVLDILYGRHTFVNAPLARHYGLDAPGATNARWVKVDDADKVGRGGVLPMGVFLTANASGLRTSPVKRGYWVVRRVLGERIPPPPPMVPELPKDETKMDRPLREMLAAHRNNPACSGCHARFDSYGLVFENFGPIGERRSTDMGGKPVDTRAPFAPGVERSGMDGLRSWLRERRQDDFLDNFCRKLLSYGLGRTLLPSDEPTLRTMRRRLDSGGGKVGILIDTIVASRQFRYRRAGAAGGQP